MTAGCGCGGPASCRSESTDSLFERVGGTEWFIDLVECFYNSVESDPVLRPLFPADLSGPKKRLAMFLAQYFGGPSDYSAIRGHPRLRMRHFRFEIGPAERDAWLRLMTKAVRAGGLEPSDENEVIAYFSSTATMLMNTGGNVAVRSSKSLISIRADS